MILRRIVFLSLIVFSYDQVSGDEFEADVKTTAIQVCPFDLLPDKDLWFVFDPNRSSCDGADECLRTCLDGNSQDCFDLAVYIEQSEYSDTEKSRNNAAALHSLACSGGHVLGCTNRAAGINLSNEFFKNKDQCVFRTVEETCSFGDAWGCMMSGLQYMENPSVEMEYDRAIKRFDRSCILDPVSEACSYSEELKALIYNELGSLLLYVLRDVK